MAFALPHIQYYWAEHIVTSRIGVAQLKACRGLFPVCSIHVYPWYVVCSNYPSEPLAWAPRAPCVVYQP